MGMKGTLVNNPETFAEMMVDIKASNFVFLDTETQGRYPITDRVVGLPFCTEEEKPYYIPVMHTVGVNLDNALVMEFLELVAAEKKVVYQNAIFDMSFLATSFGIIVPAYDDLMIVTYVLGEERRSLDYLEKKYFGIEPLPFKEMMKEFFGARWQSQNRNCGEIPPEEFDPYPYNDAYFTCRLYKLLAPKIMEHSSIHKLEISVMPIAVGLNLTGSPIDRKILNDQVKQLKIDNTKLHNEILEIAGDDFKLNSPKDVNNLLFSRLGLPVLKKSRKTGAPSAGKDVLEKLVSKHPVVKKIMDCRSMTRNIKAYFEKIPESLDANERLHSNFTSTGADSGRFTSSSFTDKLGNGVGVNHQNIPKRPKGNADLRAGFIAPPGWIFMHADYSQVEYRTMMSLAGEDKMIKMFKEGVDFHTATAAFLFKMRTEDVTPKDRDKGKMFNFALSYGMKEYGLSERLGCSVEEAASLMRQYFSTVQNLTNYIQAVREKAKIDGFVKTFFGRLRYLGVEGLPPQVKEKIWNKAFNTRIQGTAADFLKIAMVRVRLDLKKGGYWNSSVQMISTVHDELNFIVKKEDFDNVASVVARAMTIPTPDDWAPIVSDFSRGPSWSSLHQKEFKPSFDKEEFSNWADVFPVEVTEAYGKEERFKLLEDFSRANPVL